MTARTVIAAVNAAVTGVPQTCSHGGGPAAGSRSPVRPAWARRASSQVAIRSSWARSARTTRHTVAYWVFSSAWPGSQPSAASTGTMIVAIFPGPVPRRRARPMACTMSVTESLGSASMMASSSGTSTPSASTRALHSTAVLFPGSARAASRWRRAAAVMVPVT